VLELDGLILEVEPVPEPNANDARLPT
jgi:hypothetical protein